MTDELDPAPAEAIDNFGALHVSQTGASRYTVVDLDEGDANEVRLGGEISCSCGHHAGNGDACRHVLYAGYKARETIEAETWALRQVGSLQADMIDVLERVGAGGGGTSTSSAAGSGGDGQEAEEPDPIDDPGDVAEGMIQSFDAWLPQAVDFDPDADAEAFDMAIVELEWAEWQGDEGIWIDTAPFGTEYWDSDAGEWADKDGFQAAREALTEVLQKRDAIQYSGDPHYVNFLPEDDVDEVV